tara:strand:+ start:705 stop:998 length:294 start_codon:yes stop_codon:yes gene_type:complete
MANEQVVSFLNDFSIEVTPNAAKKIDNFSDYLSPGTLIYIAHIEGTPIEETVATAKKITDQALKQCLIFQQELSKIKTLLKIGLEDTKMKQVLKMLF